MSSRRSAVLGGGWERLEFLPGLGAFGRDPVINHQAIFAGSAMPIRRRISTNAIDKTTSIAENSAEDVADPIDGALLWRGSNGHGADGLGFTTDRSSFGWGWFCCGIGSGAFGLVGRGCGSFGRRL